MHNLLNPLCNLWHINQSKTQRLLSWSALLSLPALTFKSTQSIGRLLFLNNLQQLLLNEYFKQLQP